jgi:hypothetical protein
MTKVSVALAPHVKAKVMVCIGVAGFCAWAQE